MLNSWYTDAYPVSDFEACWQWLTQHYANDDTVIAMDLFNKPHGRPGDADMAKWDDSKDQNNWKSKAEKVANLVLDIYPELLILVEGIGSELADGTKIPHGDEASNPNWGENFYPAAAAPLNIPKARLVLSPHTYGPSVFVQRQFMDPSQPQCTGLEGNAA